MIAEGSRWAGGQDDGWHLFCPAHLCLSASLAPPCSHHPSSCASSPSLAQLVLTPVLFLRSLLGFVLASVPCLLHVMRSRSPVAPSLCASFVISPPARLLLPDSVACLLFTVFGLQLVTAGRLFSPCLPPCLAVESFCLNRDMRRITGPITRLHEL